MANRDDSVTLSEYYHPRSSLWHPLELESRLDLPRYLSGTSGGLRASDLSNEHLEAPFLDRSLDRMWRADADARKKLFEEKRSVMTARLDAFEILVGRNDATRTITLQGIVHGTATTSLSSTPGGLRVDSLDDAMVIATNIAKSSPVELLEMVAYRVWHWRSCLFSSQLTARRSEFDGYDPLRDAREAVV